MLESIDHVRRIIERDEAGKFTVLFANKNSGYRTEDPLTQNNLQLALQSGRPIKITFGRDCVLNAAELLPD